MGKGLGRDMPHTFFKETVNIKDINKPFVFYSACVLKEWKKQRKEFLVFQLQKKNDVKLAIYEIILHLHCIIIGRQLHSYKVIRNDTFCEYLLISPCVLFPPYIFSWNNTNKRIKHKDMKRELNFRNSFSMCSVTTSYLLYRTKVYCP